MHVPEVIFYTRQDCPLCDKAYNVLVQYGLLITVIDIDSDPKLHDRYDDCVPVVMIDGKQRFRGQVNEVLLRRLLSNRRV